ncbi:hypothetical protein SY88_13565 [Clostridiales bacterium PH28_bin88]|nr:hypothetical protein SY88_13565 [Clostridiales bacterium PH28_bin88]
MKFLYNNFRATYFHFADSLLDFSSQWLMEFIDLLKSSNLNILWGGYLRGHVGARLADRMISAGFCRTTLGVESFSDHVLKMMVKGRSVAQNIETVRLLLRLPISVDVNLICGFPGETDHDFYQTADTWLNLLSDESEFSGKAQVAPHIFQVRPFSNIYLEPSKYGIRISYWDHTFLQNRDKTFHGLLNTIPRSFQISNLPSEEIFKRYHILSQLPIVGKKINGWGYRNHKNSYNDSDIFFLKNTVLQNKLVLDSLGHTYQIWLPFEKRFEEYTGVIKDLIESLEVGPVKYTNILGLLSLEATYSRQELTSALDSLIRNRIVGIRSA